MNVQYDIHTKFFKIYRTNFFSALYVAWHNRKQLQRINIWITFDKRKK